MKPIFGRILSAFITAGGWLLAGARTVLDLIGYSTAPEDLHVAHARLDQFFEWLLSLPWWAVWGFALASTLWLIWVSWPRPARWPPSAIDSQGSPAQHTTSHSTAVTATGHIDERAYSELVVFALENVSPTLRAQEELQAQIIREICENKNVANLAIHGITASTGDIKELWEYLNRACSGFRTSPPTMIPFDDLESYVITIEKLYEPFCKQGEVLASSGNLDSRSHPRLAPLKEKWRERHNELVEKYRPIKRDLAKFPKLFRPGRKSMWDETIP